LLGAEFAKHRMLVQSGELPATDPATDAPKVSMTEKVKGILVRQWVIEEQHHDRDLPYQPGRLDPVTKAPTNTKEEVQFNIRQSQEDAKVEAGTPGVNRKMPGVAPSSGVGPAI